MPYRRERPRCRRMINKTLAEKGWTLEEMLDGRISHTEGMRIQAEKMLFEEKLRSADG